MKDLIKQILVMTVLIFQIGIGILSMGLMFEDIAIWGIVTFILFLLMMPVTNYLLEKLTTEL